MLRILLSLSLAAATVVPLSGGAYAIPKNGDGFIVVNADGSVARASSGYTAVLYREPGEYQVTAPLGVRPCAYSVTAGTSDSSTPPASFANTVGIFEDGHVIMVSTYDATKQLADRGFHLIVRC